MPQRHRNRKRKRRTPYERTTDQTVERTPKSKPVTKNLAPKPHEYDPGRPTPLLALPRELRDEIYEDVLYSTPREQDSELLRGQGRAFDLAPEKHHHGLKGVNRQLRAEFVDAIHRLCAGGATYAFQLSLVEVCSYQIIPALQWVSFLDLQEKFRKLHIGMMLKRDQFWDSTKKDIAAKFDKCVEDSFHILFRTLGRLIRLMRNTLQLRSRVFTTDSRVAIRGQQLVIDFDVEMPVGTGRYRSERVKLLPDSPYYETMETIIRSHIEKFQDGFAHITMHQLEQELAPCQAYRQAEWSPRFDEVVFMLNGKPLEQSRDLILPDEQLKMVREERVWRRPYKRNGIGNYLISFCWLRSDISLSQEYERVWKAREKYRRQHGIEPPW